MILCLLLVLAGCQQKIVKPVKIVDPTQAPVIRAVIELYLKTRQLKYRQKMSAEKELKAEVEYQKLMKELECGEQKNDKAIPKHQGMIKK